MTPSRTAYSYVVLRYVHDVVSGECVNVGLVMVAPGARKFMAKTRKTIGRIKDLFPDLSREAFKASMDAVDRGMRGVKRQVEEEGLFAPDRNALGYAKMILPADDSALQWSAVGGGLSADPKATFDHLYERFVTRYDAKSPHRRSDDDVWKPVRDKLVERGVQVQFETKVVEGHTDSIAFEHAWKNGRWHVYEPLSFDLADADGIKQKARLWRGHLSAVCDGADENLSLHFVLGRPQNLALQVAFENAVEILKGAPFQPQIYEETEVEQLLQEIEDEVRQHHAH